MELPILEKEKTQICNSQGVLVHMNSLLLKIVVPPLN